MKHQCHISLRKDLGSRLPRSTFVCFIIDLFSKIRDRSCFLGSSFPVNSVTNSSRVILRLFHVHALDLTA
jgi:hypothetical protein